MGESVAAISIKRVETMMPMPKGATAWGKEPQRQMRPFVIRVFMSGVMLGMGIGEIRMQHFHIVWEEMPGYRWWSIGWCVLSAVFIALAARDRWRKIS
jgi:hypothetical protein